MDTHGRASGLRKTIRRVQEKAKAKVEKDTAEARYKFALIDGRKEPVGNFRVEPPGLFRGRGEHPKMGRLKKRIYPCDITINIGPGVDPPDHPYPDQAYVLLCAELL